MPFTRLLVHFWEHQHANGNIGRQWSCAWVMISNQKLTRCGLVITRCYMYIELFSSIPFRVYIIDVNCGSDESITLEIRNSHNRTISKMSNTVSISLLFMFPAYSIGSCWPLYLFYIESIIMPLSETRMAMQKPLHIMGSLVFSFLFPIVCLYSTAI